MAAQKTQGAVPINLKKILVEFNSIEQCEFSYIYIEDFFVYFHVPIFFIKYHSAIGSACMHLKGQVFKGMEKQLEKNKIKQKHTNENKIVNDQIKTKCKQKENETVQVKCLQVFNVKLN